VLGERPSTVSRRTSNGTFQTTELDLQQHSLGLNSTWNDGSERGQNYARHGYVQWLKCNGTQGNAVSPTSNLWLKAFPTSDCYNARERHTTIVRGPNLNVAFPHL